MTGVLLMAYGTPRNLDEVEAFYTDIRGGRTPAPQLVEQLRNRYRAVGGSTPLLEITRRQGAALQAALGPDFHVVVGMKHWYPYIREAVEQLAAAGVGETVALALAPHYSAMSVGAYLQEVDEARQAIGSAFGLRPVHCWHLQPRYLQAIADRARAALKDFGAQTVVFTAHSLPRRILDSGDPYVSQLQETGAALAADLRLEHWEFAFQSAGATGDAWLGPDILQTLSRLAGEDVRRVLVTPIGFIADHLEILYDLDVQAKNAAAGLGIDLRRIESLND